MSSPSRIEYPCFSCEQAFQFGPHLYAGRHIRGYQINVCDTCFGANWDGWNPRVESKLLKHLQGKGLPTPERNEKGWLPREPR